MILIICIFSYIQCVFIKIYNCDRHALTLVHYLGNGDIKVYTKVPLK